MKSQPFEDRSSDRGRHARAIGAARSGDVVAARENIEKLREGIAARQAQRRQADYSVPSSPPVELLEAEAWLAFAEGRRDEAQQVACGG
jgi:hypothetical protein